LHFNNYGVFYSQFSHQYVSAAIVVIFMLISLQQYKGANVVSCVVAP